MKLSTRLVFHVLGSAGLLIGSFAPAQQLQERPRYLLRPGDTLDLQYRLTPEFNQTVMVQPDGYINLNLAGSVLVSGLSVDQTHDLILSKESSKLNNPELTIVLESFTHPYVVVAGQVAKPGQIELKENTTALGAIMLAERFYAECESWTSHRFPEGKRLHCRGEDPPSQPHSQNGPT